MSKKKTKKVEYVVTTVWDEAMEFDTEKKALTYVNDVMAEGEFLDDMRVYVVKEVLIPVAGSLKFEKAK